MWVLDRDPMRPVYQSLLLHFTFPHTTYKFAFFVSWYLWSWCHNCKRNAIVKAMMELDKLLINQSGLVFSVIKHILYCMRYFQHRWNNKTSTHFDVFKASDSISHLLESQWLPEVKKSNKNCMHEFQHVRKSEVFSCLPWSVRMSWLCCKHYLNVRRWHTYTHCHITFVLYTSCLYSHTQPVTPCHLCFHVNSHWLMPLVIV